MKEDMEEDDGHKDPPEIVLELTVFKVCDRHPAREAEQNAHEDDQNALIEDVNVLVSLPLVRVRTDQKLYDDPHTPEVQYQGYAETVDEDDSEAEADASAYEDERHQDADGGGSPPELEFAVLIHRGFDAVVAASILRPEGGFIETGSVLPIEISHVRGEEEQEYPVHNRIDKVH